MNEETKAEASDKNAELNDRIKKARERKQAAEAKREAAKAKIELTQKAVRLEIEAADEEAIAEAEAEHGAERIGVVRTSGGCVIVKRPHSVIYKRFRDRGEAKTSDLEVLVRKSLVYPDAEKFDRMLEEQPAILDHAANRVVELAGFHAKEAAGKS